MSGQGDLDLQVLDYVYDHSAGSEPAGIGGLRDLVGEDAAARTAHSLVERGLVRRDPRLSGGYHLTAEGRSFVEVVRERRQNKSYRRAQCRDHVLAWIDAVAPSPSDPVDPQGFAGSVDGQPFTPDEASAAVDYLVQRRLLRSWQTNANGDHTIVSITAAGQECLDAGGQVGNFLSRSDVAAGQTFHVSGSGNTIAAAVGDHNKVEASSSDFDVDKALAFARAVREALPVLGTPEIVDLLEAIENETDPGLLRRATARLYQIMQDTSTGALGQMIAMGGAAALGLPGAG